MKAQIPAQAYVEPNQISGSVRQGKAADICCMDGKNTTHPKPMLPPVLATMPESSRLWFFTSAAPIEGDLLGVVERRCLEFIASWTSHGRALEAALAVVDQHFIILAADETQVQASGCSLDKVFQFMADLEKETGLTLLDRMVVVFRENEQNRALKLHEFWARRKAKLINEDTLIYDTTIRTLGAWKDGGLVPFGQSWHQQMWSS